MDPDPDPAIFVIDLHDANKKLPVFYNSFSAYYFYIFQVTKQLGIKVFFTIIG